MVTSRIKLIARMSLLHKVSKSKMVANPMISATKLLLLDYHQLTMSTDLTSQIKQFVTPVWVFGWWQIIILTMTCYGYKTPSRVIFTIVGCARWWNVPNRNLYNSTMRHLLQQVCPQQKNERLYCSMLWNLILWIPVFKKMSPSHWIKLSCLPASLFYVIPTRNS